MTAPSEPAASSGNSTAPKTREKWLAARPWILYVVPLVLFMVLTTLEPTPPEAGQPAPSSWQLEYRHYPIVYTLKIAILLATIAVLWPGYRQFPLRVSPLAIGVGLVGAAVWIGVCRLQLESALGLDKLLGLGQRSAFNPLEQLADTPAWAWGFLAIRFVGLVLVVPLIEEFFLRGFVMRYLVKPDWWEVPFGTVNRAALLAGTLVPMAMHPGELIAAALWFSLITWLMIRTKNIWDCVAAHSVTNLVLGIYVVTSGDWRLM